MLRRRSAAVVGKHSGGQRWAQGGYRRVGRRPVGAQGEAGEEVRRRGGGGTAGEGEGGDGGSTGESEEDRGARRLEHGRWQTRAARGEGGGGEVGGMAFCLALSSPVHHRCCHACVCRASVLLASGARGARW